MKITSFICLVVLMASIFVDDTNAECPLDWTMTENACYKVSSNMSKSLFESHEYCNNLNSNIASFLDLDDINKLNFNCINNTNDCVQVFWIGLFDYGDKLRWLENGEEYVSSDSVPNIKNNIIDANKCFALMVNITSKQNLSHQIIKMPCKSVFHRVGLICKMSQDTRRIIYKLPYVIKINYSQQCALLAILCVGYTCVFILTMCGQSHYGNRYPRTKIFTLIIMMLSISLLSYIFTQLVKLIFGSNSFKLNLFTITFSFVPIVLYVVASILHKHFLRPFVNRRSREVHRNATQLPPIYLNRDSTDVDKLPTYDEVVNSEANHTLLTK